MFPQRPMPPGGNPGRGFMQGPFPGGQMAGRGPAFMGRQPFNGQVPGGRGLFQGGPFGGGPAGFGGSQGFGGFGGPVQGVQQAAGSGGIKGLLSRFLPSAGGAGNVAGAAQQGIQGLANPANITGMLGNVQKVLGMAQQVTPMVQQYGPLVRNLPAMIKIFSQMNSDDTEEDTPAEENKAVKQAPAAGTAKKKKEPVSDGAESVPEISPEEKKTSPKGASKPRLYV
ncbi:VrrA/YqfQ family protein [Metabacillus sp. 84]|uniref:VrrA/YqfQ family protein n=1 Tax=unclassified Metabacillus TaxID=2675274 RepID=UPI003CF117FD